MSPITRQGHVYLVGAGPGDPKLLTLRGKECLEQADVVFYDYLANPVLLDYARPDAERVYVGRRGTGQYQVQSDINRRLIERARQGEIVVRLKGGDPFVFGRGGEEAEALAAAGVPFEVVPGVTAALAASAELGVSLTQRGFARSVAFATARVGVGERENNWVKSVAGADTAIIYMGIGQAAAIARELLAAGVAPATPVVVVENASLPTARHVRLTVAALRRAAGLGITGPAVIMLGEVFAGVAPFSIESSPPLAATA